MEICNKSKCNGCFACYNICPMKCIEMVEDSCGFVYPKIDFNKCINCGLCIKHCPNNNHVTFNDPIKVFASYSNDDKVKNNSTSGGIASQLIINILNHGGIVYCASFNSDFTVSHRRIDSINDLYLASESKYVHSYINNSYRLAKKDLIEGLQVLFIGTPCQIAGLYNFLNKEYDNLFTIDIVCHGVPSQKFLLDDLTLLNVKNLKYDKIRFRKNSEYLFQLLDNYKVVYSKKFNENYFVSGFQKSLFLRECCFYCDYKSSKRCSDLTIGDFWGLIDSNIPEYTKRSGVSLILVNNLKGLNFLTSNKFNISTFSEKLDSAIAGNKPLRENSIPSLKYYKFMKCYEKYGYKIACRRFLLFGMILSRIKHFFKNK